MTNISLDFSRRRELTLYARVIADVQAVAAAFRMTTMVTGAFARDLHIYYAYGINTIRETEDVDFALAVPDWKSFAALKHGLIETGRFRDSPGAQQRLRHTSELPVDLVPFGGVETATRHVDWPPGGDIRMDVFGFREVAASTLRIRLPDGVEATVVSLPALALLKIIAWQDRHYRMPMKDAHDLMLIVANYLDLGNQNRLWNEFHAWTEEDDFDTSRAGARMLGVDVAGLLDEDGQERVAAIIAQQADTDTPGLLPREMCSWDEERARALLEQMLKGFTRRRNVV